jgi:hypothetical protein
MRNYGAKEQVKNGDYFSLGTYSQAFLTKEITKSKRLDYKLSEILLQ